MIETFLLILTAHLLGDFAFQTKWMVINKTKLPVLLLHVGIVVIATGALLGSFHWPILLTVLITHGLLDFGKTRLRNQGYKAFIVDQAGHIGVLVILSCLFPAAASEGCWLAVFEEDSLNYFYIFLCIVSGILLVAPFGGILVGTLTKSIGEEINEAAAKVTAEGGGDDASEEDAKSVAVNLADGLTNGGQYIGWLERLLTMLFLLIGQPTGIGFLIAAKSILRFGEVKDSAHRKMAEYIIIGTFLSFGWALMVSVAIKTGVDHWMPAAAAAETKNEPLRVIVDEQVRLLLEESQEKKKEASVNKVPEPKPDPVKPTDEKGKGG